jgi:hypothetical protein
MVARRIRRSLFAITVCILMVIPGLFMGYWCVGSAASIPENVGDCGSVSIHAEGCCDGYTLVGQFTQTILIDMNGTVVHRWPSFFSKPAKMLPGGSIIAGRQFSFVGVKGMGDFAYLNEYAWNSSLVWSYHDGVDGRAGQHHDFEREGNPVGYYAPGQDFVPKGKTMFLSHQRIINESISARPIIDDVIEEVDWNGTPTGFEWHASEHFNQLGFDAKTIHGISVNPGHGNGDYLHTNSLSLLGLNKWYTEDPVTYACFNPENIIVSSRNGDYIAIISRETGDIVWRVGPDYSKNTTVGHKIGRLIGLHHAHMIPQGLPGEGDILLFDNGGWTGYSYFGMPRYFRFWSRVIEFNPVTYDVVWEYSHRTLHWMFPRTGDGHKLYSFYMSSAQRLPNGNTLITEATNGRVIEVTNTSKVVWEYATPTRVQQVYRAYRVPPEWVPGNPSGYDSWE